MRAALPAHADFSWVPSALATIRAGGGDHLGGFYHRNYIVTHARQPYVLRVPIDGCDEMDLRALDEGATLAYLWTRGFPAPRALHEEGVCGVVVHSFIPGQALDALYPFTTPLPHWIASRLGSLLRVLHHLGPPPGTGESGTAATFFARVSAHIMETHARALPRYGALFVSLGIPDDPLARVRLLADQIGERAVTLLHGDLHRKNLMLTPAQNDLVFLDWELAIVGDPAYDLAVRLHKMRYTPAEETVMLASYFGGRQRQIRAGDRDRIWSSDEGACWEAAIQAYRATECVKSAIVDAMRTARAFDASSDDQGVCRRAVARYAPKIAAARALWGLDDILSDDTILSIMTLQGRQR